LFLLRCSDHRRSQTLLKQDILALGPRGGTPLYSMNASKSTLFLLIINTSSISASSATKLVDNKGTYTTHSAVPAVCTELYSATLLATLLPNYENTLRSASTLVHFRGGTM
jgi:hypothetical protein